MRVLIDGYVYSRASFGGVVRYHDQLVRGLTACGVEVDLFVRNDATLRPGAAYPNCPLVRGLDEVGKYDIFHAPYYTDFPDIEGARTVVTIHDMIDELFPEQWGEGEAGTSRDSLKARAVARADHSIAVSRTTKRDAIRILGTRDDRITVIHHGVDAAFGPVDASEGMRMLGRELGMTGPYILHVGGREGYKNFVFLLEAYARSAVRPIAKLVAVGSQQHFLSEEESVVDLHRLRDDVVLTGYVPDVLLNSLYSCASVVAMPSRYEGFGFPMIEAFACGATVACSSAPALLELGHGVPLVFDPDDVEGAAEILHIALSEDHSRRAALGKRIAHDYSMQHMIDEYVATYQSLL